MATSGYTAKKEKENGVGKASIPTTCPGCKATIYVYDTQDHARCPYCNWY